MLDHLVLDQESYNWSFQLVSKEQLNIAWTS